MPTTTTEWPPVDVAKTAAWHAQVAHRRQVVEDTIDLLDGAAESLTDALPAFAAALLTSLLGHAVRPEQVDELMEAHRSLRAFEDDSDYRFWDRRRDDVVAAIVAGPWTA